MKRNYIILLFTIILIIPFGGNAQNDNCSGAQLLTVMPLGSTAYTSGSTAGFTQNIPGCSGNADDDGWFEFVATSSSLHIEVIASSGYDPVLQVFKNSCSFLNNMGCIDANPIGWGESYDYTGYIIGNTYRIRIYDYNAGSGSGNFQIIVTEASTAPSNDDCSAPIVLNVNTTCNFQTYNNEWATSSFVGCAGNTDDDVWFSFVATNAVQVIKVNPIDNLDLVVELFSQQCNSFSSIQCEDMALTGGMEVINAVGLIPGQTYYFRVYDYYSGQNGNFDVCVSGVPTSTPTNDEPCNAIQLPPVTSACNFATFTTVGSTATNPSGNTIDIPTGCSGSMGSPADGGFNNNTKDVWFKITVPPSGSINITSQPNVSSGWINDGVMTLYTMGADCSHLTQIACSENHANYPGSGYDLMPYLTANGLVPGSTIYLRYFGYNIEQGKFGICITDAVAINDDCANALYICDLNGYEGTTGAYYSADRPDNMHGNNETSSGANQIDGTNTGGPFGYYPPSNTPGPYSSPNIDVIIDNNSWIRFTASSTTAILNVNVYDCFIGNYPSGGIQMQIFSATSCTNFVPVSNFEENSTGFTITANGLTIGNDYYLMIDGYAGDICSYSISANSGVQFPNIPPPAPICVGESVTLTAPNGATSYEWANGTTSQSISVSPSTTTTYTCYVTGLCNHKQTLQVTVQVNQKPTITITSGSGNTICKNESVTLTAGGATSYVWNTGATGNSITVSPSSDMTYNVTGTSNGCTNVDQITVLVNNPPGLTVNPTEIPADCGVSNGSLINPGPSGSGPFNYQWTDNSANVVGNSSNLTGQPAGAYYLEVTDNNGCSNNFGPFSIANPGAPSAPSITVSQNTACEGVSVSFTAQSSNSNVTYNWTGPNGFISNNSAFSVLTNTSTTGTYCVTVTKNNCTSTATCETLSINPPPAITLNSSVKDSTACIGSDVSLSATGGTSYIWNGPNGFTRSGSPIVISSIGLNGGGWYFVEATDANGCTAIDSISVVTVGLPTADAMANSSAETAYCETGIAQLFGGGGITYEWNGPNGFSSSQQNVSIPNFSTTYTGMYILTVTDINGCNDTDTTTLAFATLDGFGITTPDTTICPGEDIILTAQNANNYAWFGPNGFTSTDNPITLSNLSSEMSGSYYVIGTNTAGCTASDTTKITIKISRDCIFIPGLITPNGDIKNDVWEVTGISAFPDAEVFIFNRWGNVTFYAKPYLNNWEGQVNKGVNIGEGKAPTGTYFYLIKLNDGKDEPLKGYIELQY